MNLLLNGTVVTLGAEWDTLVMCRGVGGGSGGEGGCWGGGGGGVVELLGGIYHSRGMTCTRPWQRQLLRRQRHAWVSTEVSPRWRSGGGGLRNKYCQTSSVMGVRNSILMLAARTGPAAAAAATAGTKRLFFLFFFLPSFTRRKIFAATTNTMTPAATTLRLTGPLLLLLLLLGPKTLLRRLSVGGKSLLRLVLTH